MLRTYFNRYVTTRTALFVGVAIGLLVAVGPDRTTEAQAIIKGTAAIQAVDSNGRGVFASAPLNCDQTVAVNISSATTTQLVALSAGKKIYVCGGVITLVPNATPPTLTFVYGTGAACGTGTISITGAFTGAAAVAAVVPLDAGVGAAFSTAASTALCVTSTGAGSSEAQGFVRYAQF